MSDDPTARGGPLVIATQFPLAETDDEMARLFERAVQYGWLPCAASTLVVRLDAESSEIAKRVADSIAAFCAGLGYVQVLLWTKSKPPAFGYPGCSYDPGLGLSNFRLLSACMPHGVPAQLLWLDQFDLVTVATVRPDNQLGLSAILAAEASMLADDRVWRLELIAEGRRLVRSDVGVVCGPLSSMDGHARAFCALSNDDVALEVAMVRAMGAHPLRLPHLRFLSTQLATSIDTPMVIGDLPVMKDLIPPTWLTMATHAFWRLMRYHDQAWADLGLAWASLERIPGFLARRGVLKWAIS